MEIGSSCEVSARPKVRVSGSRVLRFDGSFRWAGVEAAAYKEAGEHHRGVTRLQLAGGQGEGIAFHLRYFEIAPGGFSSLEKHEHEHVVTVLRGAGEVRLGDQVHPLGFGDTVYVAAGEVHQFRNPSEAEPFGFLCIVDAERDRPVVVAGQPGG
jgi:quercetin dioxygenase-like cupin family protein